MQIQTTNHVLLKSKIQTEKNIIVGTVYRAHTAIDNFIQDIDKVFHTIVAENKISYAMGDFNRPSQR
jgi:hypothetical protein